MTIRIKQNMLFIVLTSMAFFAAANPSLRGSKIFEESTPHRSLRAPLVDLIDTIIDKMPAPCKHYDGHPCDLPSISQPSRQPSFQPFQQPSRQPSKQPSMRPLSQPLSNNSTSQPSQQPSFRPIEQPSRQPSKQPSMRPSTLPLLELQSSKDPNEISPVVPKDLIDGTDGASAIAIPNTSGSTPNTVDQVINHGGNVLQGSFTVHCIWYGDWTDENKQVMR